MSRVTVKSAVVRGIEAVPVDVEVAVGGGMPGFHIVGMVDAVVLEAKERVRAAIKGAGFEFPVDKRVLVNLAPNTLRKQGSGFDLAIAVGILAATGQVAPDMGDRLFMGELGLDGKVRPVTGALVAAGYAKRRGIEAVFSAQTGITLKEYLQYKRLESACRKMLGGMKITEAAYDTGFSGSSHIASSSIKLTGLQLKKLLNL